uniref:Uncharacterized protein n=1 Tax=Anguilla anguilla TaxID=7936 RepID=A0A0E9X7K0_ANGAN
MCRRSGIIFRYLNPYHVNNYNPVIPTWMNGYGYKYPCTLIKVDNLHFNLIFIISFQIQCAGAQSQNNKYRATVQIRMDRTMYVHTRQTIQLCK